MTSSRSAPATRGTASAAVDGPIVQLTGVRKTFGGVAALDGLDLTVARGTVTGLIGPNGAGKSSAFNIITGVVSPDEGSVRIRGEEITRRSLLETAHKGVARTFQAPRGFSSMTVRQNLLVVPHTKHEGLLRSLLNGDRPRKSAVERAAQVMAQLGLEQLAGGPYAELSAGELRLVEIGRHMMRDIDLLLLDEPTAGVTPAMQERIADSVRHLNDSGITVLIVEHNLKFVFELASEISVMVKGRVIRRGTPGEVQSDPEVIAAYLGGEAG